MQGMPRPAGKSDAPAGNGEPVRCIVCLAPNGPAPRPLLQGLAKRQVRAIVAADAPHVMRQLAAAPTLAVIVTEPATQPRLDELCAAVRFYYPGARLWQYEARGRSGRPWLRPLQRGWIESRDEGAPADEADRTPAHTETRAHVAAHAAAHEDAVPTPDTLMTPTASDGGADGDEAPASATSSMSGAADESDGGSGDDGDDVKTGYQPRPHLAALSREELAMLLGSEEEDEPR